MAFDQRDEAWERHTGRSIDVVYKTLFDWLPRLQTRLGIPPAKEPFADYFAQAPECNRIKEKPAGQRDPFYCDISCDISDRTGFKIHFFAFFCKEEQTKPGQVQLDCSFSKESEGRLARLHYMG